MSEIPLLPVSQPFVKRYSRQLATAGAILTCPCHAVPLVLVLSGTSLGAALYRNMSILMIAMGGLFLLSIWLMWQTRDSRRTGVECGSCRPADGVHGRRERESDPC